MTTLAHARAVATSFGAKVEDEKNGNCHCCKIEAPHGFKWSEGDVHELVDETNRPWKPDYADMISRMKYGIYKCEDAERGDCDWCNDL